MEIVNDVRLRSSEMLDNLAVDSYQFLDEIVARSSCPKCSKSRKFFCYTCYVPMDEIAAKIPRLKLPIRVDVIKHPREVDGKSTATHAAILAPEDVSIYTYPHFPNYENKDKILMIFPGKDSSTLEEIVTRLGLETGFDVDRCKACPTKTASDSISNDGDILRRRFPFERVLLIDSTWNQVRSIRKDERLKGIARVELADRETCFWRYQRGKPRTYLATIEAIYYFLLDLHVHFIRPDYDGEYDNLLFFYKYMYEKIHTLYEPSKLRVHDPQFQ